MKPFVFNEVEYLNLNDLCQAFAKDFQVGLECIKDKKFILFLKKFKKSFKSNAFVLYETRYLQNALTFLIYQNTEDHLLVIGGQRCDSLKDILALIKNEDPLVKLFLEERGLSRTILSTLEDEKLKGSILAFEENPQDAFSQKFIVSYYEIDEVENFDVVVHPLFFESDEKFKEAIRVFSEEAIQLLLAQKFGLAQVLMMRKAECPVFQGLLLLQGEYPEEDLLPIIQNTFYWWFLDHLEFYSFTGSAKKLGDRWNDLRKYYKKCLKKNKNTLSLDLAVEMSKELYHCYLKTIQLYQENKVKAKKKNSDYELTLVYCGTFISQAFLQTHPIKLQIGDIDTVENVVLQEEPVTYDLKKMAKSIKNHTFFARWMIVFCVLYGIYYAVPFILKQFNVDFPNIIYVLDRSQQQLAEIIFLVCIGFVFLMSIFILIKKGSDRKKYNKLCRLVYFKKNSSILTKKEQATRDAILKSEAKYAKKIDRFYRFYGAIMMAVFAFATTLIAYSLVKEYGTSFQSWFDVDKMLVAPLTYLLFAPAGVIMLLALLRHKKTAWSCILTFLFSIVLTGGCLYLVTTLIH